MSIKVVINDVGARVRECFRYVDSRSADLVAEMRRDNLKS